MTSSEQNTPEPDDQRATRADLLPEEQAAGSENPDAQAQAILDDSERRTVDPDPDASKQSGRRTSEEAS
ncbi:hypothetical protein [Rhodococcus sp. X156]|uniref:hypothetical protein n=1 Tax=Rhodococcus sp. X156 TaxID=2499145 RepID=UPI000FDB2BA7|nr:hypothetical protein [Rhodococcus sp. X156]